MRMQIPGIALQVSLYLVLLCCAGCGRDSAPKSKARVVSRQRTKVETAYDHSRILKLRGKLTDHDGNRLTGSVGVLFSIYEHQEGGTPLWQEYQNVEVNDRGRFMAMVGSTRREGVPPELFRQGESLWLGKQVLLLSDEVEQPRIRLLSTPQGLTAELVIAPVVPENAEDKSAAGLQEASLEPDQQSDPQRDKAAAERLAARRGRGGLRRRTP